MGNSVQTQPVIRFQDFQVNLATGELWKSGVRLRLQDQPFKVLATLLQRPGQVVTREELRQLIWPEESFGDFDHAINMALAKLRAALGDSADIPHLIETLPRRGYRFIASAEPTTFSQSAGAPPSKANLIAGIVAVFSRTTVRWFTVGAMSALLVAIVCYLLIPRHPSRNLEVHRSVVKLEPEHILDSLRLGPPYGLNQPTRTAMAISRDGGFIVYFAIDKRLRPQDKSQLYLRPIGQLEAKPIAGAEGGSSPFLSPDERWVGFSADAKLMRVSIDGGVPAVICDQPVPNGADWAPDNTIVMSLGRDTGLFRVSADGGNPEILTTPDKSNEEYSHRFPHWLPGGKGILFTITREWFDQHPRIALLDLGTKKWRVLLDDAADARFVSSGHLVFLRQGVLMAVPFEPSKQQMKGQPFPVVPNVIQALNTAAMSTAAGQFSVSDSGSLIYAAGGVQPDREDSLVWVDRRGQSQTVTSFKAPFYAPRLSPDGSRIAYITAGKDWLPWVYDLKRGTATRLIQEGKADIPLWTPDGKHIVLKYWQTGEPNLFWVASDGSTKPENLTISHCHQVPGSFTPDGSTLAFIEGCPDTGWNINLLNMKTRQVSPFLNTKADEFYPEISPDGRWIAYMSNESGRGEIYVRPFPGQGGKWQISFDTGENPIWSRDGKQLFYTSDSEGDFWVADVRTDGRFRAGKPRLLFKSKDFVLGAPSHTWDISPDGQYFLMAKFGDRSSQPVMEMILVQNWLGELKRIAPTDRK